jgi:hypothetical protein
MAPAAPPMNSLRVVISLPLVERANIFSDERRSMRQY